MNDNINMSDNIKKTKNINLLSIVLLMLLIVVTILGGTYAVFIVSKQDNSSITGSANCYKVKYTKGQDINGVLEADTNFTSGWSTDIIMYAESGCENLTATLYLTTNSDTTMDLSDKALKYAVVLNNSVVSEGSVDGTANQVIYNNFILNTTQTTYRVYIWLDAALEDVTNFEPESYSGFIHTDVVVTSNMSFSSPLYSQIDFIESTGTQYIDTGLIVNKSDSYEYIIDANFSNDAWGGANGYLQFNSSISQNKRTTFRVVYNGSNHVEDIYVNGTLNSSNDWTDQYNGTDVKIGIFRLGNANNEWWTGGGNQNGKVYSAKIYKNGTLVRDYIPVYRKSDKEIGMYDKVNGKFYENAGSGDFIGYQRIEYIEATGTQYINTGVTGKARWEFDIQFTDLTTRQLMGYGGSGSEYWGVQEDGNYGLATWLYMNKQAGNRDTVIHNYGENSEYYLDVNGTRISMGGTDVTSKEYVLFGLGAGSYPCKAKLYGLKTIQNGVVIRDFVPVYRLNDGVIGLYDQINGIFYTNNGSGIFGDTSTYDITLISNTSNPINGGTTLTNLIQNGSFENGSTSWDLNGTQVVNTQASHGNNSLSFSTGGLAMSTQTLSKSAPTLNNKYYGRLKFLSASGFSAADNRFEWYYTDGTNSLMVFANKGNATSSWLLLSSIQTTTVNTYLSNNWYVRNFLVNSTTSSYADEIMIIDLTSAFGAGNEPTKEWMDTNISYFDGSISVKKDKAFLNNSTNFSLELSSGTSIQSVTCTNATASFYGNVISVVNATDDAVCTVDF